MAADAYTRLLGTAPEPRPLNYYQLLGLPELADDPDAVRGKGREVLARLTAYVGGPDNNEALAIITEVGQAMRVLTNPDRKAEYDKPIYERKWRQFVAFEHDVLRRRQPLSEAGRRRWIEMGIGLNLPWRDVYRHIDEVSARASAGAETGGPAVRQPQVSLEEADRIFHCLALGVEIAGQKPPEVYRQLAEAGHRLGLPDGAQASISFGASSLGPGGWRIPLPEDAVLADRERAFAFVARGAMFGRLLTPEDDMRLQEVGLRAGLTPEAARRIIDREIHGSRTVRMREMEREVAAMSAIGPDHPMELGGTAMYPPDAEDPRRIARRRRVVIAVIAAIVAAVLLAIFYRRIFPRSAETPPPERSAEAVPPQQDTALVERDALLGRIGRPDQLATARRAAGYGATAEQRIEAIRALAAQPAERWLPDLLGWIVRNDPAGEVGMGALDELGKLDYAAARGPLARVIGSGAPPEAVNRAGDLLARRRDVSAARTLMARLTAGDLIAAAQAAKVLRQMTDVELAEGSPQTEAGFWRYADLLRQWVDAGGPPPGTVWDELPPAAEILAMSGAGRDSPREKFTLRLVELGEKGQRPAWDRLVELVAAESSPRILGRLAERLLVTEPPEAVLLKVLLLGRLDREHTATVLGNLLALRGEPPAPEGSLGVMSGVFLAGEYRAWFSRAYAETAAPYAAHLAAWSPQEEFALGVRRLAELPPPDRAAETATVVAEARRGNFAAASMLVMLVREGLTGLRRDEALSSLASLGTREAWFFLVDELARAENLPRATERTLRAGFARSLPAWPEYGPTAVDRFLAWQFTMRFGLRNLDRLPSRPFLYDREVSGTTLPVLVPTASPGTVEKASQRALELYGHMTPEEQSATAGRLPTYAAAGDEVATALAKLIREGG